MAYKTRRSRIRKATFGGRLAITWLRLSHVQAMKSWGAILT